MHLQTNKNLF